MSTRSGEAGTDPARRGRFVALEGPDGAGKTTQVAAVASALGALVTREPGDTALGAQLRRLLLESRGEAAPGRRAEALMMAADRAQHVESVIEPALAAGRHVVTDRFTGSSVAYQGYGRGLDPLEVLALSHFATAGLEPDLIVLLDVPVAVTARRLGEVRDRIEAAGDGFHERVRTGFLAQADVDPERWVVIDGTAAADAVAAAVLDAVRSRLGVPS
ncbi:MAG: dTMP kinase [Microthrixaceae bacterium]